MDKNKNAGNFTKIKPDEQVVPIYDESFPATESKTTKQGKSVQINTERNAANLRDFANENKK